ncbi:MAG TPA: ABC transporter ATP-binding protein [Streptosporangiaceae bacterium]|nr:ABC transporter ATP-binding protein [Streptosporangiaceae bacterium]
MSGIIGDGAAPAGVRLKVTGLEVRLGRSGPDVVRDVSFAVPAGEVLGLVGESGSGKTTVALALLGHTRRGLRITAGQVMLDGTDLLALSPRDLRAARGARVSYVPQDPSSALNPTLRVGTQVREVLRIHGGAGPKGPAGQISSAGDRTAEVLREVSLDPTPEMLRRYPHQLSGGQQQRIALAMAFACRPSLIVLDEPTTGLDVTTQRHVLETIRGLCRSHGVAAVYVSHDLAVVSGLVSDVAVMYAGRVVEIGSAGRLFGEPVHPYTRGLIAAVPSTERAEVLTGIDGQQPRPGRRGAGCSFAARCGYAVDSCTTQVPEPVIVAGRSVRCLRASDIPATRPERLPVAAGLSAGAAPVLSVRGITASYGSTPALSGISLEVPARTCVAVVGESGSGKTTLARCVAGLHSNWTGEISFQGTPLAHGARQRDKDVLRRVQYIFQNPYTSLNPRKTVGQIIDQQLEQLTRLSRRDRSARAAGVLDDVSLAADVLSSYPDQLSGGERQRVAIARALAVEPDLLICDEVTSALDVSVQAVIVELLRQIQAERHLALVFITHNLALVRSIAQSAVVLRQGAVAESGPVEQVLEHPADPYTQRLMRDVPRLRQSEAEEPPAGSRWGSAI